MGKISQFFSRKKNVNRIVCYTKEHCDTCIFKFNFFMIILPSVYCVQALGINIQPMLGQEIVQYIFFTRLAIEVHVGL